MRKALVIFALILSAGAAARAQDKGVDHQNERIRDNSTNRAPASNGAKQDVGTGRGIDFGAGRTPTPPALPNPYRFASPNDVIQKAVLELMAERRLILDDATSRPAEGILISQPYTFIKGAVVTPGALSQAAEVPASDTGGWTRGRYTLTVEVVPTDSTNTNVSVNAKVEGRNGSVTGGSWVTLRSTGIVERDFLRLLIQKLTGGPPIGYEAIDEEP